MEDRPPSDAKELLAEISRAVSEGGFDLNEWEADFVESIGRRVAAGQELSDRQDEILEKIGTLSFKRSTRLD